MPRGPKLKTTANKPQNPPRTIPLESIEPTSFLAPVALEEFRRLVRILDGRGTLERIDLAVVTECARIKESLDRAHKINRDIFDPKMVSTIGLLTSQRRGLLREMGLSIQPSRSVVKSVAKPEKSIDPIAAKIRIAE